MFVGCVIFKHLNLVFSMFSMFSQNKKKKKKLGTKRVLLVFFVFENNKQISKTITKHALDLTKFSMQKSVFHVHVTCTACLNPEQIT